MRKLHTCPRIHQSNPKILTNPTNSYMLMKFVSQAELVGNCSRTLVGEEEEVDDLSASASGPSIEA